MSIEVTNRDLTYNKRDEASIYFKQELEYYQNYLPDVRTFQFLATLAVCTGLDQKTTSVLLSRLLDDSTFEQVDHAESDKLRSYRCLRIARILECGYELADLNPASFIFGLRLGDPVNIFPLFRSIGRPTAPPIATRKLEYELEPPEGQSLTILIGPRLPNLLAIRYDMTSKAHDLASLLFKPSIELNSRTRYELKSAMAAEYDPQGVCTSYILTSGTINSRSAFALARSHILETKQARRLVLIYELMPAWIRLDISP